MVVPLLLRTLVQRGVESMTNRLIRRTGSLDLDVPRPTNVLPLRSSQARSEHRDLPSASQDDPTIREFLDRPHAQEGRALGLRTPSVEARERALRRLRAEFVHRLGTVESRRLVHGDELLQIQNQLEGGAGAGAPGEAVRLVRLALAQNERRIAELRDQRALAETDRGWFEIVATSFRDAACESQADALIARALFR